MVILEQYTIVIPDMSCSCSLTPDLQSQVGFCVTTYQYGCNWSSLCTGAPAVHDAANHGFCCLQ